MKSCLAAVRLILKNKFDNYEDGLNFLNMNSLDERREKQALNFAKKCLRNEKLKNMFPSNKRNTKNTRNYEKYKINFAKNERYKNQLSQVFKEC